MNLGLSTGDGAADLRFSIDPDELGLAGFGLLGRGLEAADTLSDLVAKLDGSLGSVATDDAFKAIEIELGIETGTLRQLSMISRADVADAMQSVGIDHRLEDLVRYATQEELEDLAKTVELDSDIQALIDQGGSLLTVAQVIGVVLSLIHI